MAPAMATGRLRKELIKLQKEPPPGVVAEPDEKNILRWHYAIKGPTDTPFEGGVYVGKLIFPPEYPMKAPSIYMLTPSGRFQINTKLCMSMSDFHPESWNPMWSVATIIQGVQSFMASSELTTGGLKSPESEHKRLAKLSMEYNNKMFASLFGGNIQEALEIADKVRIEAEEKAQKQSQLSTMQRRGRNNRRKNNQQTDNTDTPAESNDNNNDKNENESEGGGRGRGGEQPKQELTPEEIEKRKKRNAKKRAKQKAKKAAAASTTTTETVVKDAAG